MAENNLTPEQDLLTREFFVEVAEGVNILADSQAHKRQLRAILLEILNYTQLPNGAFVETGTLVTTKLGTSDYSAYPNEWIDDARRAYDAVNNKSKPKASPSSKSTYTKVRKALLSEDV